MNIPLDPEEKNTLRKIREHIASWCTEHQWAVGACEMAAGAGMIALGIKLGCVSLGGIGLVHLPVAGAVAGGALGSTAGLLGGIGITAMGTGIGIPAGIVALGGAGILGAFGYVSGILANQFLAPAMSIAGVLSGSALVAAGLALFVDGARRFIKDEAVMRLCSRFEQGVLHLAKVTQESAKKLAEYFIPQGTSEAVLATAGGLSCAVAGAAIGTSVAASSVTVFGSSALGGLALSAGLVSAPLWPAIALGATGVAAGYGMWCLGKYCWGKRA